MYALRRIDSEAAKDVVSETFAIRRAGGLKTLSRRGRRGFEMSQKEGRPPFVS